MGDVSEFKCPNAERRRKVLWCKAVDNYCAFQRHCPTRDFGILTKESKTCKYRKDNINKTTKEK